MTIGFTIGWLTPAAADTYIRGEISGYLIPVNSPYYVIGDITVPDTLSLTIESGVHVIFLGDYLFTVYGFVSALGDSQRDGRIYIGNDSSSWRGIRFDQCSNRSSLINCDIIGARVGIDCIQSGMTIWGCNIEAKNTAINCDGSSPDISNNYRISVVGSNEVNDRLTVIALYNGSSPKISNNRLIQCVTESYNDVYGIYVRDYSAPFIKENWIEVSSYLRAHAIDAYDISKLNLKSNIIRVSARQEMLGIVAEDASGVNVHNNDIHLYGSCQQDAIGIKIGVDARVTIINNVILGNGVSIGVQNQLGEIGESSGYNLFYQHSQSQKGIWTDFDSLNFVNKDPQFVDAGFDYHLRPNSPCIDKGYPGWTDPDGTVSDIGRYYYLQPPVNVNPIEIAQNLSLINAYPNPFNGSVTISYSLIRTGRAVVDMFDLKGRLVSEIWSGNPDAGSNSITWDAQGLAGGEYIVRLKADSETKYMRIVYLP